MVQDESTLKLIVVMAVELCKYARIIELSLSGKIVWYTNGINRSVMIKKKITKEKE